MPGLDPAEGPVFPGVRGGPIEGGWFRDKVWYPLLSRSGLPRRKPHGLRHTHVSWLLAAGVSLAEVVRQMGDRPATVVKVHAHWMPGADRTVADPVDGTYSGRGGATFAGARWRAPRTET